MLNLNKNQNLKNELEKEKALKLKYKSTLIKITDNIKAYNETHSNPYTLIRNISEILQKLNIERDKGGE